MVAHHYLDVVVKQRDVATSPDNPLRHQNVTEKSYSILVYSLHLYGIRVVYFLFSFSFNDDCTIKYPSSVN